jgi:hypothetical protein
MALVKPGQTWLNLVKLVKTLLSLKRGLELIDFNTFGYFQSVLALIGLPHFACQKTGKILRVKMALWQCERKYKETKA